MKLCEVLDGYDKALRKALLILAEIFPYKFQKLRTQDYEADRPDGRLKVIASISGINIRIDVFLNRREFLDKDEIVDQLKMLNRRLNQIQGTETDDYKLATVGYDVDEEQNKDALNRRYTKIIPVSKFV